MKIPNEFANRMKNIIPNYDEFISELDNDSVKGINVNTNKISISDFKKIFPYQIKKMPYSNNSFYLEENVKFGNHPYHHAGLFYSQDPGACMPVNAITIKDDYKGMYDSKNISLAVKSDRANGYYIIIKPNQSGSFKGVTLGPDDTPKGALLENNDDTKDTGNILTSNISSSGEISAPSSAVSTGGKKVTTKKSS